jgi:hypothetical protein
MERETRQLTEEEHRQRHIELHNSLDELFADFITHQPITEGGFLQRPIIDLIEWSHSQTINPESNPTE